MAGGSGGKGSQHLPHPLDPRWHELIIIIHIHMAVYNMVRDGPFRFLLHQESKRIKDPRTGRFNLLPVEFFSGLVLKIFTV